MTVDSDNVVIPKHCFDPFFYNGSIIHNGVTVANLTQSLIKPWYNLNFIIEDLQERFQLFKINGEAWFITDAILVPIVSDFDKTHKIP